MSSTALSVTLGSPGGFKHPQVDQSLQTALQDFQGILNPDQKQQLLSQSSVPDASSAMLLTVEIDKQNAKRKSRCVAARILGFLESVQQFCSVADTFVSSNPRVAALVWGSVKLVILVHCPLGPWLLDKNVLTFMQAASNFSTYFDKLSSLLMTLRNHFPRHSKYQILYSYSTRLQGALCTYYATVVNFCKKVLEVVQRSGVCPSSKRSLMKEDG